MRYTEELRAKNKPITWIKEFNINVVLIMAPFVV